MASYSLYSFPTTIPIQRILEKIPSNKNKQNDNDENDENDENILEDNRFYFKFTYLIFCIHFFK